MRKKRIGLFVENIDSYNSEMIRGAQAACDELDEELIIFYGSGLNKKTQIDNPSTHNTFSYEFARYEQAPEDVAAKQIEERASKLVNMEE